MRKKRRPESPVGGTDVLWFLCDIIVNRYVCAADSNEQQFLLPSTKTQSLKSLFFISAAAAFCRIVCVRVHVCETWECMQRTTQKNNVQ